MMRMIDMTDVCMISNQTKPKSKQTIVINKIENNPKIKLNREIEYKEYNRDSTISNKLFTSLLACTTTQGKKGVDFCKSCFLFSHLQLASSVSDQRHIGNSNEVNRLRSTTSSKRLHND